MKKYVSILMMSMVFTILITDAHAQLAIGLKGGVNISNLNGVDVSNVKTNAYIGYHVGGFVAIKLPGLIIQPEILYSTQGTKWEEAGSTKNFKLNYFTIPVMVKVKFAKILFFETGPQFGFNTSAKLGTSDIKSTIKSSDISWALGAGIQGSSVGIGVRYNYGLSNTSGNTSTAVPDKSFKNGLFQVSLFFKLFGKM